jgi:hypothetical protein
MSQDWEAEQSFHPNFVCLHVSECLPRHTKFDQWKIVPSPLAFSTFRHAMTHLPTLLVVYQPSVLGDKCSVEAPSMGFLTPPPH